MFFGEFILIGDMDIGCVGYDLNGMGDKSKRGVCVFIHRCVIFIFLDIFEYCKSVIKGPTTNWKDIHVTSHTTLVEQPGRMLLDPRNVN